MATTLRVAARVSPLLRPKIMLHPARQSFKLPYFVRTVVTQHYTKAHEMLSYDDATSIGRLHITRHAAESLGDVVFVELPKSGTNIKQEDPIGAVESVKAASDIYAPVSGTVTSINEVLNDRPGLMGKDPEGDGWLCEIKVDDASELGALLDEAGYAKFCEEDQ